jgi:hypothetical protein
MRLHSAKPAALGLTKNLEFARRFESSPELSRRIHSVTTRRLRVVANRMRPAISRQVPHQLFAGRLCKALVASLNDGPAEPLRETHSSGEGGDPVSWREAEPTFRLIP